MPLATGTTVGPYEVVTSIGQGGMGEVYRARDGRLGRDVAVKVLPPSFASDPDLQRRFELEAKAAGMLNHPNILSIHDVGRHNETLYVVAELLEGATLRERLRDGALPLRKAMDFAVQIARGLSAAHDKGIVHRDLKPENLFVTNGGQVKILDFGLAKLEAPKGFPGNGDVAPTLPLATKPGTIMGTVGYMAPEQVRGNPADARSDIFSFGAVLYEMVTGVRAFHGETAVETMNAILKADPPELTVKNPSTPPLLDHVIRHCLEKDPEERYQSARDLAFGLGTVSGSGASTGAFVPLAAPDRGRRMWAVGAAAAVLLTIGAFGIGRSTAASAMLAAGGRTSSGPSSKGGVATPPAAVDPASFQRVTFQRGSVAFARFSPDGQTIVYDANWEGRGPRLFASRPDSAESRDLGLSPASLLDISRKGEMAINRNPGPLNLGFVGTLARVPLAGGAPRDVLENVHDAVFGPDGTTLAVVHIVDGRARIEYPVGKVLYTSNGWITHMRMSPKGDRIAFLEHPIVQDDRGSVEMIDMSGKKTTLSAGWSSIFGLAFAPSGEEVWFTATAMGAARALHAVTLEGKLRVVSRVIGTMTLQDIGRDGRVLLNHENGRMAAIAKIDGEEEKELSWLDWTFATDLSADGRRMLISESGEGGGDGYGVYVRTTDGAPAVRLGEGRAQRLSPDGKWAVSILLDPPNKIVLHPLGPGEPRTIQIAELDRVQVAVWFADSARMLLAGTARGDIEPHLYILELEGEKTTQLPHKGVGGPFVIFPDQTSLVARDIGEDVMKLYSLAPGGDGEGQPINGVEVGEIAIQLARDGKSLMVRKRAGLPVDVSLLDPATGTRKPWAKLMPYDPAGVVGVINVNVAADGKSYTYTYFRQLSTLYLATNMR